MGIETRTSFSNPKLLKFKVTKEQGREGRVGRNGKGGVSKGEKLYRERRTIKVYKTRMGGEGT